MSVIQIRIVVGVTKVTWSEIMMKSMASVLFIRTGDLLHCLPRHAPNFYSEFTFTSPVFCASFFMEIVGAEGG